jgi:membrane-associated phospholipid phosphatase
MALRVIPRCTLTELFAADENPGKFASGLNVYVRRTPNGRRRHDRHVTFFPKRNQVLTIKRFYNMIIGEMKLKKLVIYAMAISVFFYGSVILPREKSDQPVNQHQETDTEQQEKTEKEPSFFKCVLQDQGKILTSPLRIKGKDLLLWGGVALVTGVLIANDESIYRDIKEFQGKHQWVDDISPKVTKLGLGEWNLGIAGAFYLGGLLFKDKKAKETARLTVMTLIHTGIVVQLGKHLCGRQRPSWDNGRDHWAGPAGFFKRYEEGQIAHYDAFPSGHTITIFGTATVIGEMYKKTVWVPLLSYSLATMCGLSRITEDTHWLSDVFLGAALGYAIGKYIVKKRNRLGKSHLNVIPTVHSQHIGVSINYAF